MGDLAPTSPTGSLEWALLGSINADIRRAQRRNDASTETELHQLQADMQQAWVSSAMPPITYLQQIKTDSSLIRSYQRRYREQHDLVIGDKQKSNRISLAGAASVGVGMLACGLMISAGIPIALGLYVLWILATGYVVHRAQKGLLVPAQQAALQAKTGKREEARNAGDWSHYRSKDMLHDQYGVLVDTEKGDVRLRLLEYTPCSTGYKTRTLNMRKFNPEEAETIFAAKSLFDRRARRYEEEARLHMQAVQETVGDSFAQQQYTMIEQEHRAQLAQHLAEVLRG